MSVSRLGCMRFRFEHRFPINLASRFLPTGTQSSRGHWTFGPVINNQLESARAQFRDQRVTLVIITAFVGFCDLIASIRSQACLQTYGITKILKNL